MGKPWRVGFLIFVIVLASIVFLYTGEGQVSLYVTASPEQWMGASNVYVEIGNISLCRADSTWVTAYEDYIWLNLGELINKSRCLVNVTIAKGLYNQLSFYIRAANITFGQLNVTAVFTEPVQFTVRLEFTLLVLKIGVSRWVLDIRSRVVTREGGDEYAVDISGSQVSPL